MNWIIRAYHAADRFAARMMPYFLLIMSVAIVGMILFFWTLSRNRVPPEPPDFTCAQTISSTDARRIASDLHRYSSEGDSVAFYFECQDRFTVIRLGRAR